MYTYVYIYVYMYMYPHRGDASTIIIPWDIQSLVIVGMHP